MNAPVFQIGGKAVTLPPITFDMVERSIELIAGLQPNMPNMAYRGIMIDVLAIFIGGVSADLRRTITYVETDALVSGFDDAMIWAGLIRADAGEAQATSLPPSASET